MVSKLASLIKGAASTWLPINISAFLPEINESNKIASACLLICMVFPGKMITGTSVSAFNSAIVLSKLFLRNKLPPTKIKST